MIPTLKFLATTIFLLQCKLPCGECRHQSPWTAAESRAAAPWLLRAPDTWVQASSTLCISTLCACLHQNGLSPVTRPLPTPSRSTNGLSNSSPTMTYFALQIRYKTSCEPISKNSKFNKNNKIIKTSSFNNFLCFGVPQRFILGPLLFLFFAFSFLERFSRCICFCCTVYRTDLI